MVQAGLVAMGAASVEHVTGVLTDQCAQTVKEVLVHPLAVEVAVGDAAQASPFRAYLVLALTTQLVNAVRRSHQKASASGHACGPAVALATHQSLSLSLWSPSRLVTVPAEVTVLAEAAATRQSVTTAQREDVVLTKIAATGDQVRQSFPFLLYYCFNLLTLNS